MPVSFVGATSGNTASGVTIPATVTGDVIVLRVDFGGIIPPTGYTLLDFDNVSNVIARHYTAWKLASGTEPAPPLPGNATYQILVYRGATAPYIDAFQAPHPEQSISSSPGTTTTMAPLTATALDMLVWIIDVVSTTSLDAAPAGMTNRVSNSANQQLLLAYDLLLTGAGATPAEQIAMTFQTPGGSEVAFFSSLLIKGDSASSYVPAVML